MEKMINVHEFIDKLTSLNIQASNVTIITFLKENGGKKIGGKWYATEELFKKFLEGDK